MDYVEIQMLFLNWERLVICNELYIGQKLVRTMHEFSLFLLLKPYYLLFSSYVDIMQLGSENTRKRLGI